MRRPRMRKLPQLSNCPAFQLTSSLLAPRQREENLGMQPRTLRSTSLPPCGNYSKQSTVRSAVRKDSGVPSGQNQQRPHKIICGRAPGQGGYSSPEHILKQRFRSSIASLGFTQNHYSKGTSLPPVSAPYNDKTPLLGDTKLGPCPSVQRSQETEVPSGCAPRSLKSPEVSFLTARSLPSGDNLASESVVDETESKKVIESGLNERLEAKHDEPCFAWTRQGEWEGPTIEAERLPNHSNYRPMSQREVYGKNCLDGAARKLADFSLKTKECYEVGLKDSQDLSSCPQGDEVCKTRLEWEQLTRQNVRSCMHSQACLPPTKAHQEHLSNNEAREFSHYERNHDEEKKPREQALTESCGASVSFCCAKRDTRSALSPHSPVQKSEGGTQTKVAHGRKKVTSGADAEKNADLHIDRQDRRVQELLRQSSNRYVRRKALIFIRCVHSLLFPIVPTDSTPCRKSTKTNERPTTISNDHRTVELAVATCGSMNPFVVTRRRSVGLLPSERAAGRSFATDCARSNGSRRRSSSPVACNDTKHLPVFWTKKDESREYSGSRQYYVANQKNGRSLRVHVALEDAACPKGDRTTQKSLSSGTAPTQKELERRRVPVHNEGTSKNPARLTQSSKRAHRAEQNVPQHHDRSAGKATQAGSVVVKEQVVRHHDCVRNTSHGNTTDTTKEKATIEKTESIDRQILEHSWMFPRDEYRPPLSPEIPFSLDDDDEDSFFNISQIDTKSSILAQQATCRVTRLEPEENDADKVHGESSFSPDGTVRGNQESPASFQSTLVATKHTIPSTAREEDRFVSVVESVAPHPLPTKSEQLQEFDLLEKRACPTSVCSEHRRSHMEELGWSALNGRSRSAEELRDKRISRPYRNHAATAEVILFPVSSSPNARQVIGTQGTAMAVDCSMRFLSKEMALPRRGHSEGINYVTKISEMGTEFPLKSSGCLNTCVSPPCSLSQSGHRSYGGHTIEGRSKESASERMSCAGRNSVWPSAVPVSRAASVGKKNLREKGENSGCLSCHISCDSCSTVDTVSRRVSECHQGRGVLYTPAESPLPTDFDDFPSDRWDTEYEALQQSRFFCASAKNDPSQQDDKGSKATLSHRCQHQGGIPASAVEVPGRSNSSRVEVVNETHYASSHSIVGDNLKLPQNFCAGTRSKETTHKSRTSVHTATSQLNSNGPVSENSGGPTYGKTLARNSQRHTVKLRSEIKARRNLRAPTAYGEDERQSPVTDPVVCSWSHPKKAEWGRRFRIPYENMEEKLFRRVREWKETTRIAANIAESVESSTSCFLRQSASQKDFPAINWKTWTGDAQGQDSCSSDNHENPPMQTSGSILSEAITESKRYCFSHSSCVHLGGQSCILSSSGCSPIDTSVTDSLIRKAAFFVRNRQSLPLQDADACLFERETQLRGCQNEGKNDGKYCGKDIENIAPNGARLRSQAEAIEGGNANFEENAWSLGRWSAVVCTPWKLLTAPLFLEFSSSSSPDETEADSSDWSSSSPGSAESTPRSCLRPHASCPDASFVGCAHAQPREPPLRLASGGFCQDDLGGSISSISTNSEKERNYSALVTAPVGSSRSLAVERNELQDATVCCSRWFKRARRHIPPSAAGNCRQRIPHPVEDKSSANAMSLHRKIPADLACTGKERQTHSSDPVRRGCKGNDTDAENERQFDEEEKGLQVVQTKRWSRSSWFWWKPIIAAWADRSNTPGSASHTSLLNVSAPT
uniref:Uncharacterized protein n=1 Tax=Toxoplasma gondii (strain ATCC 50861 / VEG) TaxID=432359 RepID=A0A0F7VC34_TOXGV|nr:TPA: hypothetical protein BN1205_071523 [Toxoplasma gondii VEG]